MNKMSVFLFAFGLMASGCQEKEKEEVDLDRIVQLTEEEPIEWMAPQDAGLISGSTSPQELPGVESDDGEEVR